MIQAILFNSDGVLVDIERLFFEATRSAYRPSGADLFESQRARLYVVEGRRSRDIAEMLGVPSACRRR